VSVRAVWHTPELVDVDEDPFAPTIEEVGTPIVLSAEGEEARLREELVTSLAAEGELEEQGVTCKIKDAQASSCHACPLYRSDDSPLARLCAIGREQERLCTLMLVRAHGG
jgi:hypothetical protein